MLISWRLFLLNIEKVSDVTVNDVVKKTVYDKLIKKVNAIDNSKLANKTKYDVKIKDIEDKTPFVNNLSTTAALNDVGNKIADNYYFCS